MTRFITALYLAFSGLALLALTSITNAQNLIQNGDFQSSPAPIHGDNLGNNISPWQMNERPASSDPNYFWEMSVMKLASPVSNFTQPTPNSIRNSSNTGAINLLPSVDASNAPGNAARLHFYMQGGAHNFRKLSQQFTAPRKGCVKWGFSAYRYRTRSQRLSFSLYKVTDPSIADINANTSVLSGPGLQSISNFVYQPVPNNGQWKHFSKITEVEAGQQYIVSTWPVPGIALDNIFLRYISPLYCTTPIFNTAQLKPNLNIATLPLPTVTKTCQAPQAGSHNGTQGYFWNCNINVSAAASAFTLNDIATISNGSTTFTAMPNYCTGMGTANLSCNLTAAQMSTSPNVPVQLFTPNPTSSLPVTWKNCAGGSFNTGPLAKPVKQSCVRTVLQHQTQPDPLPDAEKLFLKKSCEQSQETVYNGTKGLRWECEITAIAIPTPFAGSFSFIENPSTITGSTASIINISPANSPNSWQCNPTAPTNITTCTISGANFNPSGVETVRFSLFAPFGVGPIDWKNCVSGSYLRGGKPVREIKGNCETTNSEHRSSQSPTTPPVTTPVIISGPRCDKRTTYKKGKACACRFGRAKKVSPTACACPHGTKLNAKRGRCERVLRCIKPAKLSRKGTSCLCPRGWRPNGKNGCRRAIICKKPARINRKGSACLCPRGWRPNGRNGCTKPRVIRLCVPPARPIAGARGCHCPRGWRKTSPVTCAPTRPRPEHPRPKDEQPRKGGIVIKPFG